VKIKIACVIVLLCTLIFSSVLPVYAIPAEKSDETVAVSRVAESRFLNMLNHNRVYGETFLSVDEMVNESVLGLLELRDEVDPEFIKEEFVKDHIFAMYGVDIVDLSELNADMPRKAGFVYIIPRGFDEYKHTNAHIRENEDGTFTVTTDVTISLHDGDEISARAVSLFVKNEASHFGYNIISSDIIENATDI
jgi:hypothetical protein